MGYRPVARRRTRNITVWRQGDIELHRQCRAGSHAMPVCREDTVPARPVHGMTVVDARQAGAFDHAVSKAPRPTKATTRRSTSRQSSAYAAPCSTSSKRPGGKGCGRSTPNLSGCGERDPQAARRRFLLPHRLTHNVCKRRHGQVVDGLRRDLFGFRRNSFSTLPQAHRPYQPHDHLAMRQESAVPLDKSTERQEPDRGISQEVPRQGRQHIDIGTEESTRPRTGCRRRAEMVHARPDTYYEKSFTERVSGHDEPLERMKKHGILIDDEGIIDGGMTKILLQIFPGQSSDQSSSGFIQRKGDKGFGEGNFRALFESIEEDQIRQRRAQGQERIRVMSPKGVQRIREDEMHRTMA